MYVDESLDNNHKPQTGTTSMSMSRWNVEQCGKYSQWDVAHLRSGEGQRHIIIKTNLKMSC